MRNQDTYQPILSRRGFMLGAGGLGVAVAFGAMPDLDAAAGDLDPRGRHPA